MNFSLFSATLLATARGVSGALFRKPAPAEAEEAPLPLEWLMSDL
jgi:hypothetical protein